MAGKFIAPTCGRVVLLANVGGPGITGVGLVTKVHNDRLINAAGWDEFNGAVAYTSLQLVQEGDTPPGPGTPHAHWMPYQMGQAEKTAEIQSVLDAERDKGDRSA